MNSDIIHKISRRIGIIVKSKAFKEIFSWVRVIAIAVVVALFVNRFIIINAYVPTGSMEDTIDAKSKMIGLRTAYWFSDPKRGDIIIFKYPVDEDRIFTKRIIGLPGETIQIVDGVVYIDGKILDEPYLKTVPIGSFPVDKDGNIGEYVVPEKSYFCLGDNRNNSNDSRYWDTNPNDDIDFTYVKRNQILGKAIFSYWPDFNFLK